MSRTTTRSIEGRFVVAYVEGVANVSTAFKNRALDILEDNGITDPQPDEQYSVDAFAAALEAMADSVGPVTTRKIGSNMVGYVEWPPSLDSVEEGFETMIEMHKRVHGNADEAAIGTYEFELTGDGEGRVACTSNYPYPVSFAEGVIEGTIDEFTPDGTLLRVNETDARSNEKCAYEISW